MQRYHAPETAQPYGQQAPKGRQPTPHENCCNPGNAWLLTRKAAELAKQKYAFRLRPVQHIDAQTEQDASNVANVAENGKMNMYPGEDAGMLEAATLATGEGAEAEGQQTGT